MVGDGSKNKNRTCYTYGEVLPDGSIIDLVLASHGNGIELRYWDREKSVISGEIEHDGVVYRAPTLHPSILQAVAFPAGLREYRSESALFDEVCNLFSRFLGLPTQFAILATAWVFSTWLPELFVAPPVLCIDSRVTNQVQVLFRLLYPLCRRALVVGELSPRLPTDLSPTLLVIDSGLSESKRLRWRDCNHRGVFVAGGRGTLRELACSKAVFSEQNQAADWGAEAIPLFLLPTVGKCSPITRGVQVEIASEYQPTFEMYRLRRLQRSQAGSVNFQRALLDLELHRDLLTCVPDDPAIHQAITPLLQSQNDELKMRPSTDPNVVILEALWGPAHELSEISPREVTERVNDILANRGETQFFNPWEIGWRLRHLGLDRRRNAKSKLLQFRAEMRQRIHQIACQFGLDLRTWENCSECAAGKIIAG